MVTASKMPMLKSSEYELWRMRIEQYIKIFDYSMWEVIETGDTLQEKTTDDKGLTKIVPIKSAEDKAQRRLETKTHSILMMGLPNEYQLTFNHIKDAKSLMEAIDKRFGGNEATKKSRKNLLKQQFENITASSSETLDVTYDRLQKLNSQLALVQVIIPQEDINIKFLRSLSSD